MGIRNKGMEKEVKSGFRKSPEMVVMISQILHANLFQILMAKYHHPGGRVSVTSTRVNSLPLGSNSVSPL